MKVALTTLGETLEAPLDPRFGRAPRFLVFDTDTTAFEIVDNRAGMEAAQGAGVQAAETLARLGVRGLVTGHCGPKALRVLLQAGIQVYNTDVPTVAAALEAYRAGKLVTAEPTVSGEHDLDRLLVLARHFDVPVSVCVNKWDVNPGMTERIERRARRAGAGVVGRVRQDPAVSRAQVRGRAIVETGAAAADDVRRLWDQLRLMLEQPGRGETDGREREGPTDGPWQPAVEGH